MGEEQKYSKPYKTCHPARYEGASRRVTPVWLVIGQHIVMLCPVSITKQRQRQFCGMATR